MRLPAVIEPWLATEELQAWVREAPDKASFQRRLAVWMTHVGRLPAHRVAEFLCASKQAVWLWISQYNRAGPEGLEREGRGGRRWAYLPLQEEQAFLAKAWERAARGEILIAKQLHGQLERATGRQLSLGYVYGLLHRHGWRKLGPRPRHPRADQDEQQKFKKNFPRSSPKR